MDGFGLVSSIDDSQFTDRLKYKPSLIEFHLYEGDLFGQRRELLEERIQYCILKGIKVYLHHPVNYLNKRQDILTEELSRNLYFDLSLAILYELSETYDIFTVVQPHYHKPVREINLANTRLLFEKMLPYQEQYGDRILWGNSSGGLFSTENPHLLGEIVKPLKLSMCYDISHAFIALKGDNTRTEESLKELLSYVNYYHVCDSMGFTQDSLPITQGNIDWLRFTPYFLNEDFVIENALEDENNAVSNLDSLEYLYKIARSNEL